MSLNLDKRDKYANPYYTNWDYLENMTALQMKALNEIEWDEEYKYIDPGLWAVPWSIFSESAKNSVEYFITDLNKKIMEL